MNQKKLISILAILVITIGVITYLIMPQKQIVTNQPAVVEKKDTTPKADQNTITEQDMANLKIALEKEQPEYVSAVKPTWTIEVGAKNGRYIRATLYKNGEFVPSYPSFYAYKADDGWKIIFSGQETPNCNIVNSMNFPKDIVDECLEGNKTIQR